MYAAKKTIAAIFCLPVSVCWGQTFGNLHQSSIQDSAVVCMTVGLKASIAGLDDIHLKTNGVDGAAGTLYHGSDTFYLESNGGVSVFASAQPLTFQNHEINAFYLIDGKMHAYATPNNEIHASEHTLTAIAQLGNISSQLTGNYSTTIFLTVMPSLGIDGGCGQQTITMAKDQSNWAFIAYEDLYPDHGDADYNDFVMAFQSSESYNASGYLETINMTYIPVARGAGYNHSVHLDLDGEIWNSKNITTITDELFHGDAVVKATYTNLANGTQIEKYYQKDKDVTIFYNTRAALDGYANVFDDGDITSPLWRTDIQITMANPELNSYLERGDITDSSYRIYLNVNNTHKDIDLYTVNSGDGMIDKDGYPFGLIIPQEWRWPLEGVNMETVYPHFKEYRDWLSGKTDTLTYEAEHWYLSPIENGQLIDGNTVDTIINSAL